MKPEKTEGPVVRMENVSKTFTGGGRETWALKNVTFEARRGELVLLLGPSGSGKSTFLTILAGLQSPSEGEVSIFGKSLSGYSKKGLQKLRASEIGFIFQTFQLLEPLTALENIMLAMKFIRTPKQEAKTRALELLERFGISHLRRAYPRTMSQGEKQRVAIARALANKPALVIADEPTGSLATFQGMQIVQLIKDIAKTENRCAVIASHDQRIVDLADRVLWISDGEVFTSSPLPA